MRIIIEETSEGLTCRISRRVGKSGHSIACSTFSNCDKAMKKKVKTMLMTILIRITNGEMDQQTQGLLEGMVLEQGR